MAVNYLMLPQKRLYISQSYDGSYSHIKYSTGSPPSYPIDMVNDNVANGGFFCPCDEMKIVKLQKRPSDNSYPNGVWLTSTSPCVLAGGGTIPPSSSAIVTIKWVHMNDDDYSTFYIGKTYTRGQYITNQGTSGHATGAHIEQQIGLGTISGSGGQYNSKGAYILKTTGGNIKPQYAMWQNLDFTTIVQSKGLTFRTYNGDTPDPPTPPTPVPTPPKFPTHKHRSIFWILGW